MENKTCGECKYYNDAMFHCEKFDCMAEDGWSCPDCEEKEKPKPTNGDRIRQMSNKELATHKITPNCFTCTFGERFKDGAWCKAPAGKTDCCKEGYLEWLNAPAESEGEDE